MWNIGTSHIHTYLPSPTDLILGLGFVEVWVCFVEHNISCTLYVVVVLEAPDQRLEEVRGEPRLARLWLSVVLAQHWFDSLSSLSQVIMRDLDT